MNFYKEAASKLDLIESKKASIKGCLSLAAPKDRKRMGALIIETLKFKGTITTLIEATPMMRDERRHLFSKNFAAVLVHDLLFSSGGIQAGDGPIKQAVNRHKTRLQAELTKLKIRRGVKSNQELAQPDDPRSANIPRYLRVNRNIWTTEQAIEFYSSKGYAPCGDPGVPPKCVDDYFTFDTVIDYKSRKQFRLDDHVPDLLIFNPVHELHHDEAYKTGKMIAQDKASCFPAVVLDPPAVENAWVIDATAAPGNKASSTSHISALMGNKGKIIAFERNKRRYKTLHEMVRRAKCQNVETILGDFLEQDPLDERFKLVTHIGSGIVNRLDYLTQDIPSVERIVYSTCSVHATENEGVVGDVLASSEFATRGFKVAPRSQVLPNWSRRGITTTSLDAKVSDALIRCLPGEDSPGTNGFFVSCFIREKGTGWDSSRGADPSFKRKIDLVIIVVFLFETTASRAITQCCCTPLPPASCVPVQTIKMWKPAGRAITGTNDIPLGNKRRFGPAVIEDVPKAEIAQASPSSFPRSSVVQDEPGYGPTSATLSEPDLPRKRKSRWGDAKSEPVGLPTAISSSGVSQRELDNYAVKIRLDEINRKLQTNTFIPPESERSPSPPPTYDSHGRRTNTREVRYRKKLEEERVRLVDRAMKSDPNFRPPAEYHQQKRSLRPQDKVYIPVKEFPEINFFGLLVGPRGNSLKKMEKESGAKISIRGKGSVKEGKGRPDAYADDSEEDLHCLVMADSDEKVASCVALINKVIETAASTPEGQNDHKRNQLRELAALNGTLRDDENQICQNCAGVGHRKYDCPEQRNYTANIICRTCGNTGHMARDCISRRGDPNGFGQPNGFGAPQAPFTPNTSTPSTGNKAFDSEYASLMAELGEGAGGNKSGGGVWRGDGSMPLSGLDPNSSVPPWRRPEMWQTPTVNQGYRPPYGGMASGVYNGNSPWAQAGYQQYPPAGGASAAGVDAAAYAQYYQSMGYNAGQAS
ncbi:splicing factor SF1 [Rhizoctonia solani]|uniref:Branchpoint-bridging protein n=2 Tax=Rhizoctonia solani TaxID=456999 RepID=A0A8H8NRH7_9AGAM|nr:splicing factor SF1 [Rhizoctonia solani]QRW18005.1 splicing factor SF1 [Rhizoctonia solani]